MYAHTQTFLPKDHGRSIVQKSYLSGWIHFHVHYAPGTASRALAHMLDSLVRVSRRDDEKYFVRVSPSLNSYGTQTDFQTFLQVGRKLNIPWKSYSKIASRSSRYTAVKSRVPLCVPTKRHTLLFIWRTLFHSENTSSHLKTVLRGKPKSDRDVTWTTLCHWRSHLKWQIKVRWYST